MLCSTRSPTPRRITTSSTSPSSTTAVCRLGGLSGADAPTGAGVGVDSHLPNVMVVTAGRVDASVVPFAYGDQSFGSTDQQHHCNFAVDLDSDTHTRSGHCGFSCWRAGSGLHVWKEGGMYL